jgi:Protein of unknown function (DUF2946)
MVLPTLLPYRLWIAKSLQQVAVARRAVSREPIAAFAALVLAFNLLIPAMAGATVKRDQLASFLNVICTSSGLKVLVPDAATGSSHSQQSGVHCPLCVLGAAPPLPSHALSFAVVFLTTKVSPRVWLESSIAEIYWPSASPRGPPAIA